MDNTIAEKKDKISTRHLGTIYFRFIHGKKIQNKSLRNCVETIRSTKYV